MPLKMDFLVKTEHLLTDNFFRNKDTHKEREGNINDMIFWLVNNLASINMPGKTRYIYSLNSNSPYVSACVWMQLCVSVCV